MQGVVDVVGPLGGHAQAWHLGRWRLVGGSDDTDVVEVGLRHQAQGAAQLGGQGGHGVGELGQDVRLGWVGGCGVVLDLVDGVQPQGVDVEVPQPAQGGVDDEGTHLLAAVMVVVDGLAPGRVVGPGEVRAEDAEVVARRAQVVVDDVEAHPDAGAVGGVDEAGQGLGASVGLVDRPQSHSVIAPAGLAGKGCQRHELDDVDAQIGQVTQAGDGGVQGALWGEGAHVKLVDDRAEQLLARPVLVGPLPRGRVHGSRGAVDAVRLQGAARIGAVRGAVHTEGVVGTRLQVEGRGPPSSGGRDHADQPVVPGQVQLHAPG